MVLATPARAQQIDDSPHSIAACSAHPEWAFCNDAWNGLATFAQIVDKSFQRPCFAQIGADRNDTDLAHPICANAPIELWIAPRHALASDFIKRAKMGKQIIVFDKGDLSAQIYKDVEASSLDDKPSWHINANEALPVIELATPWPSNDILPTPIRIAWNHPDPIRDQNRDIYAFQATFPHSSARDALSAGSLTVFRDESLPIELMLQTLDNRIWMEYVFKHICPDPPCRIDVYAPYTDYSELSKNTEYNSTFSELLRSLDKLKSELSPIPWHVVIAIALSFWIGIIIFIIIPPRRPRA